MSGLDELTRREYPGRLFIVGRDQSNENCVIIYAATGRSPPSRMRRLVERQDASGMIQMTASKDAPIGEGNPDLLFYNAIRRNGSTYVVSNGAQTDMALQAMQKNRNRSLVDAFRESYLVEGNKPGERIDLACYEPDAPNWTPRITAVVSPDWMAAMIIKENHGERDNEYFTGLKNAAGVGNLLCTYSGKNVPKGVRIPSWEGPPVKCLIEGTTPKDVAEKVYVALGPKTGPGILQPGDDFRVGVAVVFHNIKTNSSTTYCVNRLEK